MRKFLTSAALALFAWINLAIADPLPHEHTVIVPFDASKPVAEQSPENYFLDEATFNRLWKLAKENRKPAPSDPAPNATEQAQGYTISSALYRVTAHKDHLNIDARLSLHTFGKDWNRVPLAFGGAQLRSITLDAAPAAYEAGHLLVEKSGAHTIDVQFQIARSEGWREATWAIPPAAAAMVALKLENPQSRATINAGRALVTAADGTSTAAIGSADSIKIQLSGITRGAAEAREPTSVQIDARLYITPAIERLEGDFHYSFDGASLDKFSLSFDPSITPTGFRIANLKSWILREEATSQTLEFVLAQPAKDRLSISLIGERDTPQAIPADLKFPHLGATARRTESHLGLFHANSLQIRAEPEAAFRRSPPKNRDADSGFDFAAAFNTSADPAALSYALSASMPERRVEANYVFQIGDSKLETVAKLDLISPHADLLSAAITIPEGMKVQSVASTRLQDWWSDGQKLQLRFNGLTPDRTIVILNLARTLDQKPKEIAFAPLAIDGFDKATGTGLVIAHMATRTVLNFDRRRTSVREISAAEAGREFEVLAPYEQKHGFAFDVPDFIARVSLEELEAKFDASWVMLAEAFDNWVRLGARVDVELTRAALKRVRFTLPATIPEAQVTGDSVREVSSSIVGENREYLVSFQSDVVNAVQFDIATEIPNGGVAELPDITLPDADRLERFVIVENLSKDELKLEAQAAEITPRAMFPYFDESITSKWLYRAREDWGMKLMLEKLETSAGNRAVVLLAELTTALRRNGDQWVNANYRIQNRSLQFLPIKLPDGAELISVKVAGENVRADRSSDGDTYLIPLVQTKPGQLAYPVECVYLQRGQNPLGSGASPTLDDPDLIGIVVEKTVWNVSVPEGYTLNSFDGNMNEVPEAQRKIEQLSSMETELTRLNRVATSEKMSAETRQLARRNAQNLSSVYSSALEAAEQASRNKSGRRSSFSVSSSSRIYREIDPQFQQMRETLEEQKAVAFGEGDTPQTTQLASAGAAGQRKYYWKKNSNHISSRHNEIYNQAKSQGERVAGQLNVNDNLIILGDNRVMLEESDKAPSKEGKKGEKSAEGGRRSQLSKLDEQNQTDNSRIAQQRSDQLNSFNALANPRALSAEELEEEQSAFTISGNGLALSSLNSRANPFTFDANAVPQLALPQLAQPSPLLNDANGALTTTLPVSQRFKPVGRVSLDVEFPTSEQVYHFKKLKDHAVLTLDIAPPKTKNRTAIFALLIGCLAVLGIGDRVIRGARRPQ